MFSVGFREKIKFHGFIREITFTKRKIHKVLKLATQTAKIAFYGVSRRFQGQLENTHLVSRNLQFAVVPTRIVDIEDFDGLPREFLVLRWIAHELWRMRKLATQTVKSGFYGVSH